MSGTCPQDGLQHLRDRYQEIAQLSGGLAHEIRNPLSTISLNIGVLREELKGSDLPRDRRMLQRLDAVNKECDRLETILNEFLQFARAAELEFVPCDLSDFLIEVIQSVKPDLERAGIEISSHLDSGLPPVAINRDHLWRAILNLIRNAREATPAGGIIECLTHHLDDSVVIEIIDNGEGIPENVRAKIFDPFYSTKSNGSGLGLPTVQKIVEEHGGTIECASEVGKGTSFRISLPISSGFAE